MKRRMSVQMKNRVLIHVLVCLAVTAAKTTSEDDGPTARETRASGVIIQNEWKCPNITKPLAVECSCDFPHTLRCTGDKTALQVISRRLRMFRAGTISLLDITVTGTSVLPARFLEGVPLHGLVVSTGELRRVNESAFSALARSLQALGLPNNLLESVPSTALHSLTGLERLDLSHNKLDTLKANSFAGLTNLTYLDLSDNLLSQLSPQAFPGLVSLRLLKMRGNSLSVSALSALRGLKNLEELDLSSNLLVGPTTPNLLPRMPTLRLLTIAGNKLVQVQRGALQGLPNLTSLSLSNNQIDVLEDHAFRNLSTLTKLDLANNRIVAVSSASLAHLEKLTSLDLTHNFLRSLTPDLILPLKNLQDLRLDDNDISMVASEILTPNLKLKRLSLADNPLNCDCTLLDFANWLTNSTFLNEEDRDSAVCATPPALENGILAQVSPGSLLCGEPVPPFATLAPSVPAPGTQITLKDFDYQESGAINLIWNIEPCSRTYTCDRLMVYETITGGNEVLVESRPLRCESRHMSDPCNLPVTLPSNLLLEPGHKYRYCIAIFQSVGDLYLVPGCSDVFVLERNTALQSLTPSSPTPTGPKIAAIRTNASDDGFLYVDVNLVGRGPRDPDCELSLVIFSAESVVRERKLNCSRSYATITDLVQGPYRVCVTLQEFESRTDRPPKTRCVDVTVRGVRHGARLEIVLFVVIVVSCGLLVAALWAGRSLLNKSRPTRIQGQCFLPAEEFEITHRARYVKLLTTTKV
ncbi:leucine-rich repeats and immunoglobulin-like domains protein 3 [Athalia rosae]|uniref:leucine-rich repeats and immunoglobulin-like domains protein 3 n=1 Tax=Athalia rosae TaxID=37344 RepID=UPI002033B1BA|nr:leucine-rich repeats and immunoglobulin-like domains protein 3 [Athalia rosae]